MWGKEVAHKGIPKVEGMVRYISRSQLGLALLTFQSSVE